MAIEYTIWMEGKPFHVTERTSLAESYLERGYRVTVRVDGEVAP